MGLDATVYCDCLEHNRLRSQPLDEWLVSVDPEYGSRVCGAEELSVQEAFDQWNENACDHESGMLVSHYIGNMGSIALLRKTTKPLAESLPLIQGMIVYSGSHSGDFIELSLIPELFAELKTLSKLRGGSSEENDSLRQFARQFRELSKAALKVGKPIVF